MALNNRTINALGILSMRKLEFIPEHFTTHSIDKLIEIELIECWIKFNLASRYAIKKIFLLDSNNIVIEKTNIGIEDPTEMTMFLLACPYLNKI